MTILIIGATGNVGRHLVSELLDAGAGVRALVRNPDLAWLPPQVELVPGDLSDPASVAVKADAAFLLWPFLSADGAAEVIDTLARHVPRIVYLSAMSADDGYWGEIEKLVEAAGVEWTFLRAGGFATNTLEWANRIRAGDVIRIPYAGAARSLIHEKDIAAVAARVLLKDGHTGKRYELTGPEVVTQEEQVRIIGETTGRPLRVEELPVEVARQQMLDRWRDPGFVDSALDYWSSLVTRPERVTKTVAEVTGRPARTYRDWAADHADDFRVLDTAEIADRYVAAFRAGRLDTALDLLHPEIERFAPLEPGESPVRGISEIMANSRQLNADYEINDVAIAGPYLAPDQFAVRFSFDETHQPTGTRGTTTKMSLYTVADGRITREEVYYLSKLVAESN